MAEVNKRQYKDLDKRITEIKNWMDEQKSDLSDRNLMNNFSFLISVMERYQDAMESSKQQLNQMQQGIAENFQVVEEFLERTDGKEEWDKFLTEKREEAQKKFDEANDPNYKIKQELADAEAEAKNEDGEDDKTED